MKSINEHIQPIFDEYKIKIQEQNYHPKSPLDTLKSRLIAVILLNSDDPCIIKTAENFIKDTSTAKEDDLRRLKLFASTIKSWDKLEVCSQYMNNVSPYIEYKLMVTKVDNVQINVHYHACYQMEDDKCFFVSQFEPLIRVIGDSVLHQPGIIFPTDSTFEQQEELRNQIECAKSVLIKTGGAGIAANQCANIKLPYQFTIVGVFYDDLQHVTAVARRYPGVKFPEARIMINPKIIDYSNEKQNFKHACLSVPCSNRCEVQSPQQITVTYLDYTQNMRDTKLTVKGTDAVVLWHELTHILYGNTYIDVTFSALTLLDLQKFKTIIKNELESRQLNTSFIPNLTIPPFHFTVTISAEGISELDEEILSNALSKMTNETLHGILERCQSYINKKNTMEILYENSGFSIFGTFSNNDPHSDIGSQERLGL